MDFRPTQEQQLLRDSVRRYFAAAPAQGAPDDVRDWRQFAEFGWLAMPVAEADGGLEAGLVELSIVSEEIGAALSGAPFVAGAVLPARVLARCTPGEARTDALAALADGTRRFALAAYEPDRRYLLTPGTRAVRRADGGYRLSGDKTLVAGGAQADRVLVTAATEADARPLLFIVDVAAAGVRRHCYEAVDGTSLADFQFEAVQVAAPLADADHARSILEIALDETTICLCADLIGGMDQAIQQTAAYLRMRKQFGRALAEFQALQHAVAEMSIDANSVRSLLYRAIAAFASGDDRQRQRAVAACAIKTLQIAKTLTGSAVHLHGGIGMTCEYSVGRYLLRALVNERLLCDREQQLDRYMACAAVA